MNLISVDVFDDIKLRIEKIRKLMKEEEIDALLIASNTNIYYTTGRFFRGYVYLPSEGEPLWFVIKPETFDEALYLKYIRKPEMIPEVLEKSGYPMPGKIGLELDNLTFSEVGRLEKVFGNSTMVNCSQILKKSRMTKTPYELKKMREDGIHQAEAYHRVPHLYKNGMTDLEFQIEIERVLRLEGCLGVVRTSGNLMEINLGSVIVGDNADEPGPYDFTMGGTGVDSSNPVGANGKIMHPGETVMIDMNGSFNGYQTDMTRVWRLGEIPELAFKSHNCSIRILRELEKMSLPGIPVADLYKRAIQIVEEEGLKEYFMGHRSQVGFIGHGVGIELNEPPVIMAKSKDKLQENMTLAIEPKFVIPGVGATGVENTYIVTANGLENITKFPEELKEL